MTTVGREMLLVSWKGTRLEIRGSWVRIPPEAADVSMKSLPHVELCCLAL